MSEFTTAEIAAIVLLFFSAGFAFHCWHLYQKVNVALNEWRRRWFNAEVVCIVPGCGQPVEADCHVEWDFADATTKQWGKHRPIKGRLVAEPNFIVREGIGVGA